MVDCDMSIGEDGVPEGRDPSEEVAIHLHGLGEVHAKVSVVMEDLVCYLQLALADQL